MELTDRYGLGRLPAADPRDAAYTMRALMRVEPTAVRRYFRSGPVLDQGPFPHCVGYAWRQWLASAPIMVKADRGMAPQSIYHAAQRVDEWEGEGYAGTSVRAGAKVLDGAGYVAEYRWAWNARDAADWILLGHGAVVLGTTWYRQMFTPDPKTGRLRLEGPRDGGHAYLAIGYERPRGRFRILNSWGRGWGVGGRAWLDGEDLDTLLRDGGEACTALERKVDAAYG